MNECTKSLRSKPQRNEMKAKFDIINLFICLLVFLIFINYLMLIWHPLLLLHFSTRRHLWHVAVDILFSCRPLWRSRRHRPRAIWLEVAAARLIAFSTDSSPSFSMPSCHRFSAIQLSILPPLLKTRIS